MSRLRITAAVATLVFVVAALLASSARPEHHVTAPPQRPAPTRVMPTASPPPFLEGLDVLVAQQAATSAANTAAWLDALTAAVTLPPQIAAPSGGAETPSSEEQALPAAGGSFPSDEWFYALGRCEQPGTGEHGVQWDSEGVYPGGLGILHAAWVEFGGEEFAPRGSMATPAQQILVARRLYARYGAQPWSCRTTVGDGY